jgi:antitoxin (DNA-binding transcriptional repressor) of toxin-antitoxin stability system
MYHMKRASVRDLRYNFPKIERMLRAGEDIEITKRNTVIGTLVPPNHKPVEYPDFRGRMKEMFGDKILEPSNAEIIAEDRDRF